MRNVTAAAFVAARTQGIDAQVIVRVDWPSPFSTTYYGEKDGFVGSTPVLGRIAEAVKHSSVVRDEASADASSLTLVFNDHDGHFYGRQTLSNSPIERATVAVFAWFEGTGFADMVELLSGRMGSPILFTEKDRRFRFDVVTRVVSGPCSTTLTQDEDSSIADEADGTPFPLALGFPRDVPAVLYKRGPRTVLKEDADSTDTTLELDDGSEFPAGTIKLVVDGEIVTGQVSGNTFVASTRNDFKYQGVQSSSRNSSSADISNPFVLWINDSSLDVVGYWFILGAGDQPGSNPRQQRNFCIAQKGTKCVFAKPWTRIDNGGPSGWPEALLIGSGLPFNVRRFEFDWIDKANVNASQWVAKAGSTVTQLGNDFAEYVCNDIPSLGISRVRAWKQHQKNVHGLERRRLVSVPSSYYTVKLNDATLVPGQNVTSIRLPLALDARQEGWDDSTVYVTLRSSVGSNVADQIEWLLENRANLVADSTTFADVRSAITKYRADFAITDGRDALDAARDLAWQARCSLLVSGSVAKLSYLSKPPDGADLSLGKADVLEDGYGLTHTDSDRVYTVVPARWKKHGGEEEFRKLKKTANEDVWGVKPLGGVEGREFWAYAHRKLVAKSAQFWVNRYSRTWRVIDVACGLSMIAAEPFDLVAMNMNDVFAGGVLVGLPCRVLEAHLTSKPWGIRLKLWMPVESGPSIQSPAAYLSDGSDTSFADPNVAPGSAQVARISPYAFTTVAEPFLQNVIVQITKVIDSRRAECDVLPQGQSGPVSGSALLTSLTATSPLWVVGQRGVAWESPTGGYLTDVWAGH